MKNLLTKEDYFLQTSIDFYEKNLKNREIFLKKFRYLFDEISSFLNTCINNPKKIIFFCCGNSTIANKIIADEKYINEIVKHDHLNYLKEENIKNFDHIIIADIEHQKNISENLIELSKNITDDARIIVISKSLVWSLLIKIYKKIFHKFAPSSYNFLPYQNLKSYLMESNLEIIRNEKIIFLPFYIPYFTNLLNKIFRLPVLNFFCLINITIVKRKNIKENYHSISYIIPCKNEEGNIEKFEEELKNNKNEEFLFGDDNSSDSTKQKILKLMEKFHNVSIYDGPGISKSKNVYKGIELSNGEIIVIYDADHTVKFEDIKKAIKILNSTNADMINCTRMIYPQEINAMKRLNFFGNIMFAKFFSIIFDKKITDTLCGTKIFYKKNWSALAKYTSCWGIEDRWGDFDLLLSAYKNNLKIIEVPVHYYERDSGKTKMVSLISNTLRMFFLVLNGFYNLKIKNK
jgi:hypothetical protein